jgi:phage tail sheath protein FI
MEGVKAMSQRKGPENNSQGVEYQYPGVYVEEVSSGTRPIEGVGTAVAAFIGFARRQPVLAAVAAALVIAAVGAVVRAMRR